jgi:hypothetical protein
MWFESRQYVATREVILFALLNGDWPSVEMMRSRAGPRKSLKGRAVAGETRSAARLVGLGRAFARGRPSVGLLH